jgi:hypothetical protein
MYCFEYFMTVEKVKYFCFYPSKHIVFCIYHTPYHYDLYSYIVSIQRSYVFPVIATIDSVYFPNGRQPVGLCNGNVMCFKVLTP